MCIYAWARYHAVVTLAHIQSNPFYHPDVTHVRKDTRPSPALPYRMRRKARLGLGTRLSVSPKNSISLCELDSIKPHCSEGSSVISASSDESESLKDAESIGNG